MPRVATTGGGVPLYGGQQVALNPLPGVRKQAAETPDSAGAGVAEAQYREGGAIAALGEAGAKAAGQFLDMRNAEALDAKKTADQTAVLDASNQLSDWTTGALYDPQNGALQKKGKDALGVPETTLDAFDQKANDVAGTLGTEKQQLAFQRVRLEARQSLDLTLRRHTLGEMQSYQSGELKAYVDNATNAAVQNSQDPIRIKSELDNATAAITNQGPRLGMGPEEVTAAVAKAQNSVHVGVIDRLLSLDKTTAARIYFEETKDQIEGDAQTKITKALEDAGTRAEGQKQADAIVAAGGTLTDQREKARQIEDPKVRDEVMARVEHENAINEKAQRDQEENRLIGAYNIVDKTHDVAAIPSNAWSQLTGASRSALRTYATTLAKGIPVETDMPTYYSLMRAAADDPQTFSTSNLLTWRAKLGDTEFKQLADMQLSIRNGDRRKADEQLADFRTKDEILKDTLGHYGITTLTKPEKDWTADERNAIANVREQLDLAVASLNARPGAKKATNDEIQTALDRILSKGTPAKPGSWWGLLGTGYFGGPTLFTQPAKGLIDTKPGDIPAPERKQIEDALRSHNRPVTDQTVLEMYIARRASQK